MAEKIELDVDLATIRNELKQMQTELQKTGAEGSTVFQDLVSDAQAMAKAQREVTSEIEHTTAATKRSDQATGSFGARVRAAIVDFNIAGKSIGEWVQQGGGLLRFLGAGEGAVGKFGGAFKVLGNIIKLSPLGLLVGVIASLIGYFTRFQSGIDKVSQVMAGVSAVVNVLIDRFLKLGSAIVNVFKGDFIAAANDVKGAVGGIGDELARAATEAANLEKRFQEIRDASRTSSVEAARLKIELEKAKQIADDTTQSYSRRISAAQKANEIERKLADTALDFAADRLAAEQRFFALNKDNGDAKDRLAKAEIDFANAQIERNSVIFDGEKAIEGIRKEAAEASKKRAAEAKKERDEMLKDLDKLRLATQTPGSEDRAIAEIQKKYADLIAIAQKNIDKLNDIETKGALDKDQIAKREEFKDIIVKLQKVELEELSNVLIEYAQKDIEIEEARQRELKARREKDIEAQRKAVEDIRDIRESEIALNEQNFKNFIKVAQANGASKEEIAKQQAIFDKLIQADRLKNEIETQEKLLALTDAGDTAAIEKLKNKILKAKAELEGLNIPDGNKPPKKGPFSLGSLLGLDGTDLEDFEKAVAIVKDGLKELTDARLEAARVAVQVAEEEVRASQEKVDNAESDLERELELAKLGFASDVSNAQDRLKQAEEEEKAAQVRKEKAIQEQKKQQRTQILLDSALQASNIITAATNVFKGFSVIPGVGQILGAAAVAFLIGSFIGAKAKALQATKARHGIQGRIGAKGIIVGPSHEEGGVPLEVEGGEFTYQDGKRIAVVKKEATNDHFGLLQAINSDDRPTMAHYLRRLTGGISRDQSIGSKAPSSAGSSSAIRFEDKETHALLRENNELQRKKLFLEENRESVYDMGDYLLIKKGGRSERLQKRKTK